MELQTTFEDLKTTKMMYDDCWFVWGVYYFRKIVWRRKSDWRLTKKKDQILSKGELLSAKLLIEKVNKCSFTDTRELIKPMLNLVMHNLWTTFKEKCN
jgi:hypothetical protein